MCKHFSFLKLYVPSKYCRFIAENALESVLSDNLLTEITVDETRRIHCLENLHLIMINAVYVNELFFLLCVHDMARVDSDGDGGRFFSLECFIIK